jgi:lysophospholipase L1-like esterase
MRPRSRETLMKAVLATVSILFTVAVFEIGLRVTRKTPAGSNPPPMSNFCGPCPELFDLNPRHPTVSPQGLRDHEYAPTPPEGTTRILVLGDSVSYGLKVKPADAFPKRLEKMLEERGGKVEVMNAGTPAYSPYNEWKIYEAKFAAFHPDVVLVSFCMNDVVDPSLHWASMTTLEGARAVPAEAIPDLAWHRDVAMPEVEREWNKEHSGTRKLLLHSEIFRRLDAYVQSLKPLPHVTVGGKTWTANLSAGDPMTMEVLTDYDSPQWVWLRKMYDAFGASVRAHGASFGILWNPVEYQMDPDYPLKPSAAFARYCAERKLPCFDPLPALLEHRSEKLFIGTKDGIIDIWHYTPAGHEVVARTLADGMVASGMLPKK